jgi:hypothetical protein
MALSKEQILAAQDQPLHCESVPEWSGDVYLRILPGTEREELEAWIAQRKQPDGEVDQRGLKARLLVKALADEHGQPLFTDEDLPALEGKSGAVLDRLAAKAMVLNGLDKETQEALRKNLSAVRNGAFTSG